MVYRLVALLHIKFSKIISDQYEQIRTKYTMLNRTKKRTLTNIKITCCGKFPLFWCSRGRNGEVNCGVCRPWNIWWTFFFCGGPRLTVYQINNSNLDWLFSAPETNTQSCIFIIVTSNINPPTQNHVEEISARLNFEFFFLNYWHAAQALRDMGLCLFTLSQP